MSIFYGIDDPEHLSHEDIHECIEDYLDGGAPKLEHEFEVQAYRTMTVNKSWFRPLEDLIERLDDEYGSPDEATTFPEEIRELLKEAERKFVDLVVEHYPVWACEKIGEPIKVNGLEWAKQWRPEWITESAEADNESP
jgi:hypothetical protein